MKKYIILSCIAAACMSASAQDFDTTPAVQVENKTEQVKFTIGGRFMADAAYYNVDEPYVADQNIDANMHSGASIVDARIRTSMSYKDFYLYADFGFGGGKFAQKNIFAQWQHQNERGNTHAVKVGYYNDPAGSMSRQTSLASHHFISRAGASNALGDGRALGVSYKFRNDYMFFYQGVFSENQYNKIDAGFNGVTVAGRWLGHVYPTGTDNLHFGVSAGFTQLGGGERFTTKGSSVLKKTYSLGQSMETYVDPTEKFVGGDIAWADKVLKFGAEALYNNDRFFARGEYLHKSVFTKRDSYSIFIAQQDNVDGWGDFGLWQDANPLQDYHFNGGYIELGGILWGNAKYKYNDADATLGGLNGQALELVGRFNITNLNNVNEGDYYSEMRDQYYPAGYMEDWPYGSSSFGGGKIMSGTVGLNYAFNRYVQFMVDYTFSHLDRDKFQYAKNFHALQARLQFVF